MIDKDAFTRALDDVVTGWNTGDRETFMGGYRQMADGELHLENPVGSPVQTGWALLEKLFDEHQPQVRVETGLLIVNGDEAAAVMHNTHTAAGQTVISVETYHRQADGSLLVRYFNPHA